MDTKSNELAKSYDFVPARLYSLSRNELFAGLYILGCANGLLGRVLLAFRTDGWAGLLGIDVSVIVLFVCFAGLSLIVSGGPDRLRSTDLAVAVVFLLLVTLPIFAL